MVEIHIRSQHKHWPNRGGVMILWQPYKVQNRRRNRLFLALTIKLAVSAIALSALITPRPWVVYNASASVPSAGIRLIHPAR